MGVILGTEIVGFVEVTADNTVVGWAFSPVSASPIELGLFVNGQQVDTQLCDNQRPDVLDRGFGREHVGFNFQIPTMYCDGQQHFVEIRTSNGRPVEFSDDHGGKRTEWTFSVAPEYPIAQIDAWNGRDIHCWAIVVDRRTRKKRPADYVIVRQSGHDVATLSPTISRPDVADKFGCHPNCGFVFPAKQIRQLGATSPLHLYVSPDGREIDGSPLELSRLQVNRSKPAVAVSAETPDSAAVPNSADAHADQIAALKASGLFDEAFYLQTYPDMANADISCFDHFYGFGFSEGRRPNQYFEPAWYLQQYPEAAKSGIQPLLHFFLHGDQLGLNPGPLFDVKWYRERYQIPPNENTLVHYLRLRFENPLSPLPDFDAEFYALRNPDVLAARVDMFDHFFSYGYRECRNPSADFDVKFYVQRYLKGDFSTNPLIHFWAHRHESGVHGRPPDDEVTVSREIKRFCRPGSYFEEPQGSGPALNLQAMLLAYYLPQFHTFPENDAWWGKGFTEWTNLIRGSPRFIGHYQPRVPRDLGFYSLDTTEPMRQQIKLALASGVSGFVFYYYWFNGKRLMEEPVQRFLADPTLNIKFALMWANENWTRRWDGAESEVLISQDYHPGDDHAMAAEFAECFGDSRYIRLQGRPLLMIYRAGIIPDVRQAIARWREMFNTEFNENPIFVMAQAFNAEDPRDFGFDGAIEFPPHKLTTHMAPVNAQFTYLDEDFAGQIHQYDDVVAASLREPFPDFPLIKTAVPSWDNDSRRQGTGLVITGSTPPKYEAWLARLVEIAKEHSFFGEPIVCINAWNEWCEGAYLEPDLHFGGAYLNATARAITGRPRSTHLPRLILLGHDAFPGGAQHLLLNIGRTLRTHFGIEFEYVLLGGGDMVAAYAEQGLLTVVTSDSQLSDKLRTLVDSGFCGAIVNTSAAARAVAFLQAADIRSVLLIHELPRILREKHLTEHARVGLTEASTIIFSSPFVRDAVLGELRLTRDDRTIILPQGSYKDIRWDSAGAVEIAREFGLSQNDHIVLGVGYADLRKGFDLFLQIWRILQDAVAADATIGRICMVWVGGIDPGLADWLALEIAVAEDTGTFRMAGYRNDVAALFSAAAAFALTSREDPLPTVVMEALSAGLPVVAFDQTGGVPDMLREIKEGDIVPYGDVAAMARAILRQVATGITQAQRESRHAKIATSFNFANYAGKLMKLALPNLAQVSVALPNYNYAQYMPARLGSIFQQTYPVHEVLVLDDCSRDDSLDIIPKVACAANRAIRLIANEANSGSVFIQWRRAAELATGEFVWIAEADDLCDTDFLLRAITLLSEDSAVQLAFTDSRTIDVEGKPEWESYKGYYATIEPGALAATAIFDAPEFVRRFLAVKNLILNVSAVVWRRDALLRALESCADALPQFRMAGDWLLYLTALSVPNARIGYEARPLNIHRRHAASVTHALAADRHIAEIARCHQVAASTFALPDNVRLAQRAYLAEVTEQLGATLQG